MDESDADAAFLGLLTVSRGFFDFLHRIESDPH